LDLVARLIDRDRQVVSVHFDAAAPGRVPPAAESELLCAMRTQFHFSSALQEACRGDESGVYRCSIVSECDQLGFGAGAASRISDRLFRNAKDLSAWKRTIDRGLLAVGPAGRMDVTSRHVTTATPVSSRDRR
jgi:hypothetical protein